MTDSRQNQNTLIQQEFTKQAQAYASNPTIIDQDWALRLVEAAKPQAQDRVLEVASGPGYVSLAFANIAQEVVGIDLTDAPLAIAEKNKQERGLSNVNFEKGDAYQLHFDDASFDIVVCRLAVHHFSDQKQVLKEMARVCRLGGKVVIEDLISSEHADRADYYNHWERLRDPSHTIALSLSDFLANYRDLGLEVVYIQMEDRTQDVEEWMQNSQTPADQAVEIRQLLADDKANGLSGLHVYHNADNRLCFDHRMATFVGQK
ncbi:MAG: methyltransferase domain-containing protein [Chloroflexota bacterium]